MDADTAWAAGFIDGEGCFYASIDNRGSVRIVIQVGQRLREPLDHLQALFGGTIAPVVNGGRPAYIFSISSRQQVVDCVDRLSPYLRCKADQAAVLRDIAQHLLDHGGQGARSGIDKEWCKVKIETLRAQKRPWKF